MTHGELRSSMILSHIEDKTAVYEERVALVVADSEYMFEGNEVFINFYGCNLSSGFNKN